MLLKHFQIIPVRCAMGNESSESRVSMDDDEYSESANDIDDTEKDMEFE